MNTVLKELPSGKIEIVKYSGRVVIQFNCSCMDALPFCNAACCRNRPIYNAPVAHDELHKFDHTNERDGAISLNVLANVNGHCTYLDDASCLCNVHKDKPKVCAGWHCSPGGVGEGIKERENGWILIPDFSGRKK